MAEGIWSGLTGERWRVSAQLPGGKNRHSGPRLLSSPELLAWIEAAVEEGALALWARQVVPREGDVDALGG